MRMPRPIGTLDLVVAVDAVPYVGEIEELMELVAAVLRPGGVFVLNVDLMEDATELNMTKFETKGRVTVDDEVQGGNVERQQRQQQQQQQRGQDAAHTNDAPFMRSSSHQAPLDFDLQFSGRWEHRSAYVRHAAMEAGLVMRHYEVIKGASHFSSPAPGKILRSDELISHSGAIFVLQLASDRMPLK